MSYFRYDPPESSCVRTLCRYDHNYVEMTHDGLLTSPSYFDRITGDESATRCNIFGREDVEGVIQFPARLSQHDVILEAISGSPRQEKSGISSFRGDEIFVKSSPGSAFRSSQCLQSDSSTDEQHKPERKISSSLSAISSKDLELFDTPFEGFDPPRPSVEDQSFHQYYPQGHSGKGFSVDLKRRSFEQFGFKVRSADGILVVSRVSDDSIASRLGIEVGDEITHINNRAVDSQNAHQEALNVIKYSRSLNLRMYRMSFSVASRPSTNKRDRITVELKRKRDTLGLTLCKSPSGGICIQRVKRGCKCRPALREGDELVSVNGVNVQEITLHDVDCLLRTCENNIRMAVLRERSSQMSVVLERSRDYPLGLGVEIRQTDSGSTSVRIRDVLRDSSASRCPQLRTGLHIIAINGRPVDDMTYRDILQLLKNPIIKTFLITLLKDDDSGDEATSNSMSCLNSFYPRNSKQ